MGVWFGIANWIAREREEELVSRMLGWNLGDLASISRLSHGLPVST